MRGRVAPLVLVVTAGLVLGAATAAWAEDPEPTATATPAVVAPSDEPTSVVEVVAGDEAAPVVVVWSAEQHDEVMAVAVAFLVVGLSQVVVQATTAVRLLSR